MSEEIQSEKPISDGILIYCFGKVFQKIYLILVSFGWASLIAQLVKNPPAMQETLVQFLGREDPLEKG